MSQVPYPASGHDGAEPPLPGDSVRDGSTRGPEADKILAEAAPRIQYASLSARAAGLEMKLDPQGTRRRKEAARERARRVEARREASGNMSFGGRELAVEEALAARAANDADAAGLRRAGLAGSLRELRVLAMLDRMMGRDPFDRIPATGTTGAGADGQPRGGAADEPGDAGPGGPGGGPGDGDPGEPAAAVPGPVPALINLIVPAGTLLGWSTAPGDAGGLGLLDPADTAALVRAASRHPATRWCLTITGGDGTAVAHGCARGPHPWTPPPPGAEPGRGGLGRACDGTATRAGPDEHQAAHLAALLRELNITLTPIAKGSCDHRGREDRYTPSRKLGHLVRARTVTCPAPGCGARAVHCDLDHTIAYPQGPTCQCDLSPPAEGTTAPSRPPAGISNSPHQASCAGPRPRGAPTPPHPPSTTRDRRAIAVLG